MTYFFFTSLLALLGMAVGSFVNALVYRLHEGMTLLGRSFCPRCRHAIAWYDNIPFFSFLLLRGRCRHCPARISLQYPVVELLGGVLFALVASVYVSASGLTAWPAAVWLLSLTFIFLAIAVYDFRYLEIPLFLVYAGVAVTLFYLGWVGRTAAFDLTHPLVLGLLGGTVIASFFFLLVFFSRETWMGWGDVWIGFLAGLAVGLSQAFFLLTLSFTLGAVVGLGAMALGKKKMKSALPFGPFLALGTLIVLLLEARFPAFLAFFFFG